MNLKNVEIKARCEDPDSVRKILKNHDADFKGLDHQVDTYFNVDEGRLKLREGHIENSLIYYRRDNIKKPKTSDINLISLEDTGAIKTLLTRALGIWITIDKYREIYYIDNVKFHIDRVQKLGNFIEIEAIDRDGSFSEAELRKQCEHFLELFDVADEDLVSISYSDMKE